MPLLRSTNVVSGYHIQASDGEIGIVEDFIVDDEMWAIRYLIVGTRNWWPGARVPKFCNCSVKFSYDLFNFELYQ